MLDPAGREIWASEEPGGVTVKILTLNVVPPDNAGDGCDVFATGVSEDVEVFVRPLIIEGLSVCVLEAMAVAAEMPVAPIVPPVAEVGFDAFIREFGVAVVDVGRVTVTATVLPCVSIDVMMGWLLPVGNWTLRVCAGSGTTKT